MKHEPDLLRINEAKWDKWAETLDGNSWTSRMLRRGQKGVLELIGVKENINFLDIGCGTGWAVGQAAALAANKGSFYGADLSLKMIEKAKDSFKGNGALHFIRADVESIPLDSVFFDTVMCTNSFHHYPHPDRALAEMHRLLKAGGTLYLLDPTADTLFIRLIDLIGKMVEPAHVKLYSSKEFRSMFGEAGLEYSASTVPATRQKVHIGKKN